MAKYCAKCNKLFENDGVKFCSACGSSEFIAAEATEAAETAEATGATSFAAEATESQSEALPAAEVTAAEQFAAAQETAPAAVPAAEPAAYAETPADTAEAPAVLAGEPVAPAGEANPITVSDISEEPKKKKKFGIKKIAFIAIPLILVAAIVFNYSFLYGWFLRIFGMDKSYLKYVEKKAFENYADTLGESLGSYTDGANANKRLTTEVTVKIDSSVDALLKQYNANIDLSWLSGLKMTYDINSYGDLMALKAVLGIGDSDIFSASLYGDKNLDRAFIKLDDVTSDILSIDLAELKSQIGYSAMNASQYTGAIAKIIPDSAVLKKLAAKYVEIAINDIEDISTDSKTVTIEGISQKLKVIKYKINEKTAKKIVKDVLKEAKNDSDIKKIVNNAKDALVELGAMGDSTDVYEEFQKGIDKLIEQIDKDNENSSDSLIISDYVNNVHEIVGREIKMSSSDEQVLSYVTVEKGKKRATEVKIGENVKISGKGEKNNGKVTGNYDLEANGKQVGTVKFTDFDVEALKKGELKGAVRFTPDSSLIKNTENGGFISMLDPAIEFEFDCGKNGGDINIKLLGGGSELIGLYTKTVVGEGEKISLPKGNTLDISDSDDMLEFIEGIDLSKVISRIKKSGIPTTYAYIIQYALNNAVEELKEQYERNVLYDYYDYYGDGEVDPFIDIDPFEGDDDDYYDYSDYYDSGDTVVFN